MTPDQIKQITDAIKQGQNVTIIVIIVLILADAFFRAYMAKKGENRAAIEDGKSIKYWEEKGKNFATKEDIGEITRAVEGVRTELASKAHFGKLRYEREMHVYTELWKNLCETEKIIRSLRPVMDTSLAEGETRKGRILKRAEGVEKCYNDLQDSIYQNRPFYPLEIWRGLVDLLGLFRFELMDSATVEEVKGLEYWDSALKNSDAMTKQIEKVCEAIRDRLAKFD